MITGKAIILDQASFFSSYRATTIITLADLRFHHSVRDKAMGAFASDTGNAKYNYAHAHDGWLTLLAYQIDLYKYDIVTVNQEGVSFWYRTNLKDACNSGGTTVCPRGVLLS